jgi:hypothetical protein
MELRHTDPFALTACLAAQTIRGLGPRIVFQPPGLRPSRRLLSLALVLRSHHGEI